MVSRTLSIADVSNNCLPISPMVLACVLKNFTRNLKPAQISG